MSLRRTGLVGRAARALVVAAGAILVVGCTPGAPDGDGSPSPSPSPSSIEEAAGDGTDDGAQRVAVIIPPEDIVAPAEGAALARAAEALADDPPQGVDEVRVARASTPAFVRDLANLAVDDGYDVVCVVGTGTAELALELARARRATRICTTDGRIVGGPVNLVAVAVDPAALVEAGAVAIGTAPAPVGLLVSPQVGDADALTSAFTASVAPPRQPRPSPAPTEEAAAADPTDPASAAAPPSPPATVSPQAAFVTVAPGSSVAAQEQGGQELAAERPSRALLLATPGGAAAARAAGTRGAELVVVSDWVVDPEGELPPNLLVAMTVDWGALLRDAIEAARTPDAAQVQLRGIDAGVLGALPGQVPEAVAAADRTSEHLRRSTS